MSSGRFEYTIGFKTDTNGLKQTLTALQKIQNMTTDMPGFKDMSAEIAQARKGAFDLEQALTKAFNPKMGTVNTTALRNELSKLNLAAIKEDLLKMGPAGETAFNQVAASAMKANLQLKQSNNLLTKFGNTLFRNLEWMVAGKLITTISSVFTKTYGFTKNLDSSLNDIRIVTGKSADEMARFGQEAQKTALELGKGTTDITNASLIYFQQGLDEKEVEKRTEVTAKMANVTGQAAETVANQMTAVWNGFQAGNDELERYADVMTKVAASTASSSAELAGAISKTASIAKITGVDMEQLTSMISTVISVTRDSPETVGTAFKTIFARINDLVEDGTDEFGVSLGRVSSHLAAMGIEILNQDGTLKDLGKTITETGEKWNFYSREQQIAIAEQMGGKRQWGQILALFDHWDDYKDTLLEARDATGSLDEQQEIYMDRVETHLQQVKTAWEAVYAQIFNEKDIITVADAIRDVLKGVETFLDTVGGFKPVLDMVITMMMQAFGPKMAQEIDRTITNIQNVFSNRAAENAQRDITLMFGNLNDNGLLSELVQHQKVMNKYKDQMNEKDEEQYSNYLKQKIALSEQTKELHKQVEEAKEFALARNGIGDAYTKAGGFDNEKFALAEIEDRLKNIQALRQGDIGSLSSDYALGTDVNVFNQMKEQRSKDITGLITQLQQYKNTAESVSNVNEKEIAGINKLINSLQGVKNVFDTATLNNKEFEKSLDKTTTSAEKAATQLLNLKNATPSIARDNVLNQVGVSGQGTSTFAQFREENNRMLESSKASITTYKNLVKELGDASILSADQVNILNTKLAQQVPDLEAVKVALREQLGVSEQGLENIMRVISQHSEAQLKIAEDTRKVLDNAQASMEKSLSFRGLLTNMTRIASLASQIAMSFNQILNIGRIIQDEDIKGSEKIGRVISSIAMTLPMMTSLFSGLMNSPLIKDITESRAKRITADAALERATQKSNAAHQAKLDAEESLRKKNLEYKQARDKINSENTRHRTVMSNLKKEKAEAMAPAKTTEEAAKKTAEEYKKTGHTAGGQHKYNKLTDKLVQRQAEGEDIVAQKEIQISEEKRLTEAERKRIKANIEVTASEKAKAATELKSAAATETNTAKTLKQAEADKIAAKTAQKTAIMRAAGIGLIIALVATAIICYKKVKEAEENLKEAREKNAKILQDHIKANQDLIKSNEKVLKSFQDYDKVWDSFKKGKATVDELRTSIEGLAQLLDLEDNEEYSRLKRLAEYTGNYDALNQYLQDRQRQNRIELQQKTYAALANEMKAARDDLYGHYQTKRMGLRVSDLDGGEAGFIRHYQNKTLFPEIFGSAYSSKRTFTGGIVGQIDFAQMSEKDLENARDKLISLKGEYQNKNIIADISDMLNAIEQYLPKPAEKKASMQEKVWDIVSGKDTTPIEAYRDYGRGRKEHLSFSGFSFDENTTEQDIQKQLNNFAEVYRLASAAKGLVISEEEAYQFGFNVFMQTQSGAQDALTSIEYKNHIKDSINQTIEDINKDRPKGEQLRLFDDNTINNIEEKLKTVNLAFKDIDWTAVAQDPELIKALNDGEISEDDIERLKEYRTNLQYLTQDYVALASSYDEFDKKVEKGSFDVGTYNSKAFQEFFNQDVQEEIRAVYGETSNVAKAIDILNDTALIGTSKWKEAWKLYGEALKNAEIEQAIQSFSKKVNDLAKKRFELNGEDFKNSLEQALNDDYHVDIKIRTNIDNAVQEILSEMDEMSKAASKIGENFVVSRDDLNSLAEAFPGILDEMTTLTDGSIQLNEAIAKSAIERVRKEKEARLNEKIEQYKDYIEFLEFKKKINAKMIEAAEKLAEGNVSTEAEATEQISIITEGLSTLKVANARWSAGEDADLRQDELDAWQNYYKLLDEEDKKAWTAIIERRQKAIFAEDTSEIEGIEYKESLDSWGDIQKKLISYHHAGWEAVKDGVVYGAYQEPVDSRSILESKRALLEVQRRGTEYLKIFRDREKDYDAEIQTTYEQISKTEAQIKALSVEFSNIGAIKNKDTKDTKDNTNAEKDAAEVKQEIIDLLNEEIDAYHDVNIEIERNTTALNRLQKAQEKLTNKDLIQNYQNQIKQLDKLNDRLKEKQRLQYEEASTYRNILESEGVTFNEDGTIANYGSRLNQKMKEIQEDQAWYNSLSGEEQEEHKDWIEKREKEYDSLVDYIEKYDDLWNKAIPELADEISDNIDKQLELTLTITKTEVEIVIEKGSLERAKLDLEKTLGKIQEVDIAGNLVYDVKTLFSYYDSDEMKKVKEYYDKMSHLYQQETVGGKEASRQTLDAYKDALEQYTKFMQDMASKEQEFISNAFDRVNKKIERQKAQFEAINNLFEHDMNLVKLTYGDKAYEQLRTLYKAKEQVARAQLENANITIARIQEELQRAKQLGNADYIQEVEDKLRDSLVAQRQAVENYLNAIKESSENTINAIFTHLDESIAGVSLDKMKKQWDDMEKDSTDYYDAVNGSYEIEKLRNQMKKAINETDDPATQKALNDLMNDEITKLQQKDKLSKYDIERAQALFDIEQKRAAFREAQNNKTKMRLRRDSSGNYTYQFVSDEDRVTSAMQDLADAQNQLYNIDKEAYQNNLQKMYEYYEAWQQELKENADASEEERAAITQKWMDRIAVEQEQILEKRYNLENTALEEWSKLSGESIDNMAAREKDAIMNDLIPVWGSYVEQLALADDLLARMQATSADIIAEQARPQLEATLNGISIDALAQGFDNSVATIEAMTVSTEELNKDIKEVSTVIGEILIELQSERPTLEKVATVLEKYENGALVPTTSGSLTNWIPTISGNQNSKTGDTLGYYGAAQNSYYNLIGATQSNYGLLTKQSNEDLKKYLNKATDMVEYTSKIVKSLSNSLNRIYEQQQQLISLQIEREKLLKSLEKYQQHTSQIREVPIQIKAEFPNVSAAHEIEHAFDMLINQATQDAFSTLR